MKRWRLLLTPSDCTWDGVSGSITGSSSRWSIGVSKKKLVRPNQDSKSYFDTSDETSLLITANGTVEGSARLLSLGPGPQWPTGPQMVLGCSCCMPKDRKKDDRDWATEPIVEFYWAESGSRSILRVRYNTHYNQGLIRDGGEGANLTRSHVYAKCIDDIICASPDMCQQESFSNREH